MKKNLIIRELGLRDYDATYQAMKAFTDSRTEHACDEIWLLEHTPVFTLGRKGDMNHVLDAGNIPVIQTDRGGQVTYHGPGQLVVYLLLDLQRRAMGIRSLVNTIQDSIMRLLLNYNIDSSTRRDAPGVYVEAKKIASLGLRVRRGCCYHGMSLNIAMDLAPFKRINPCGYVGLEVTQIGDFGVPDNIDSVAADLIDSLPYHLGYDQISINDTLITEGALFHDSQHVGIR